MIEAWDPRGPQEVGELLRIADKAAREAADPVITEPAQQVNTPN